MCIRDSGYAAVKQVFGGEITSYTELLTEARTEALERLAANAGKSLKSRALFFCIGPTCAKAACFVHVSPS